MNRKTIRVCNGFTSGYNLNGERLNQEGEVMKTVGKKGDGKLHRDAYQRLFHLS